MKRYTEIVNTRIIEEDGHESESIREYLHTIRTWDELSDEEKEKEIQLRSESIYMRYQEDLYEDYKMELDSIRDDFKNISFDDIYLDSNSQGGWIDRIMGFTLHDEGIEVYGAKIWVSDVDFHIRKYIDSFEVSTDNYYEDDELLEKVYNSKKYQKWLEGINRDIQNWVDRINEASKYLLQHEYVYPYNIHDDEDREWLDMYFEDEEFETTETLQASDVC